MSSNDKDLWEDSSTHIVYCSGAGALCGATTPAIACIPVNPAN